MLNSPENMGDSSYVVVDGDTIVGVALKTGTNASLLKKLNHLNESTPLNAGQVQYIGLYA